MKRIQLENRTDLKNEIPLDTPFSIFIDPTSFCNFKCKFCMNQYIDKKQKMAFDLYKKIIDSLQDFENPIKTISLYGFGEHLLNMHFTKFVEYAKASSHLLYVDTTTNGSMLNHNLSRSLINSGIDRINISIEAMSSVKYKDFTGANINFYNLLLYLFETLL